LSVVSLNFSRSYHPSYRRASA